MELSWNCGLSNEADHFAFARAPPAFCTKRLWKSFCSLYNLPIAFPLKCAIIDNVKRESTTPKDSNDTPKGEKSRQEMKKLLDKTPNLCYNDYIT
jgi:hypothetical protein